MGDDCSFVDIGGIDDHHCLNCFKLLYVAFQIHVSIS